jgi:cell wall-associated NlpC family hydrolase
MHVTTKLRTTIVIVVSAALVAGAAVPAGAGFADVPKRHWASAAIEAVASERDWMRDYGDGEFRPEEHLLRRHLARALVRAFARTEDPDASVQFSDLPQSDPHYPFANVAVQHGWMTAEGGAFRPDEAATKAELDRGLVRALELDAEIAGLDTIHTADGTRLRHPPAFPELQLAQSLGLHYNHPTSSEIREIMPSSPVRRADGAYALWRASTAGSKVTSVERFREVELPAMSEGKRKIVEFALSYVGYPYIYAAEWHSRTPKNYCCGSQPQGGFDCSGFLWWILRKPGQGYDNTAFRPYAGWKLLDRSSRDMARSTKKRLKFKKVRTTDLMFFDSGGKRKWSAVDHAGMSLGRGWMIDSSSGRGGVGLTWTKSGWYRESFVWGRRIVPRRA